MGLMGQISDTMYAADATVAVATPAARSDTVVLDRKTVLILQWQRQQTDNCIG
jgi:hypothetical protein